MSSALMQVPPWLDLLAGSAAGAASTFVTYPLDFVRTRLAYQTMGPTASSSQASSLNQPHSNQPLSSNSSSGGKTSSSMSRSNSGNGMGRNFTTASCAHPSSSSDRQQAPSQHLHAQNPRAFGSSHAATSTVQPALVASPAQQSATAAAQQQHGPQASSMHGQGSRCGGSHCSKSPASGMSTSAASSSSSSSPSSSQQGLPRQHPTRLPLNHQQSHIRSMQRSHHFLHGQAHTGDAATCSQHQSQSRQPVRPLPQQHSLQQAPMSPARCIHTASTHAASAANHVHRASAASPQLPMQLPRSIGAMLMTTVQQEGILGLYRGLGPSLAGILPYAGLKFYVYQSLKQQYARVHTSEDLAHSGLHRYRSIHLMS